MKVWLRKSQLQWTQNKFHFWIVWTKYSTAEYISGWSSPIIRFMVWLDISCKPPPNCWRVFLTIYIKTRHGKVDDPCLESTAIRFFFIIFNVGLAKTRTHIPLSSMRWFKLRLYDRQTVIVTDFLTSSVSSIVNAWRSFQTESQLRQIKPLALAMTHLDT